MRISKEKAQEILGISPATLGRRLANAAWRASVGAEKTRGKTSDVWTFDEELVRHPKAADRPTMALETTENFSGNLAVVSPEEMPPGFFNALREIFETPFERVLSLKEARRESGLPDHVLKAALRAGEIKCRPRAVRITKTGREVFSGRAEISLLSLKKFTKEYLNK